MTNPTVERTYVDITLAVDHSAVFDDEALSAAIVEALAGLTIATGSSLRLDDGTVSRHTALIEDVTEVWVKGNVP